jgi:hypothetical protein
MPPAESSPSEQPDLSRISSPADVNPEAEPETALERARLENERLAQELAGLRQDTAERKKYAGRFFLLSCAWISIITAILLLEGFGSPWKYPFKL